MSSFEQLFCWENAHKQEKRTWQKCYLLNFWSGMGLIDWIWLMIKSEGEWYAGSISDARSCAPDCAGIQRGWRGRVKCRMVRIWLLLSEARREAEERIEKMGGVNLRRWKVWTLEVCLAPSMFCLALLASCDLFATIMRSSRWQRLPEPVEKYGGPWHLEDIRFEKLHEHWDLKVLLDL